MSLSRGGKIRDNTGSNRTLTTLNTPTGSTTNLSWLLADHLGSTSVTVHLKSNRTLEKRAELRYMPWGENRASGYAESSTPTDRRYTGQIKEDIGLIFFNARWYDASLGRFIQSDHLIPGLLNPQSFDRYAYVFNNSVNMIDPSGLKPCGNDGDKCESEGKLLGIVGWELAPWEKLLLIMTVMAESMRATLSDEMIAGITWTYLNRLTLGLYDSLQEAVGGSQSAFSVFYNKYKVKTEDIEIFVNRMWGEIKDDPKWQKIERIVGSVYELWKRYGTGSSKDPTNGADSFRMKQPKADILNKPLKIGPITCFGSQSRCDRKYDLAIERAELARANSAELNSVENAYGVYEWRKANNGRYDYVSMGPDAAMGLTVYIFFDNRLTVYR
jgi:RHS repeat-associated protein